MHAAKLETGLKVKKMFGKMLNKDHRGSYLDKSHNVSALTSSHYNYRPF